MPDYIITATVQLAIGCKTGRLDEAVNFTQRVLETVIKGNGYLPEHDKVEIISAKLVK